MFESKVFVRKLVTIYTYPARSIALHEISALDHEVLDDTVKRAAFEAYRDAIFPKLSSAKLPEIFCCFGNDISKKLNLHATCVVTSDGDIKEDDWIAAHWCSLLLE